MKQTISAFALAALLVAGLAVLQPAANAQTIGRSDAALWIANSETEATTGNAVGKQDVAVTVKPTQSCTPRPGFAPLAASGADTAGEYLLEPVSSTNTSPTVVGFLDAACRYEVTYRDAAGQCPVAVSLTDGDHENAGTEVSLGSRSSSMPQRLDFGISNGQMSSNGSGAFTRINFTIDRSDSDACGSTFKPSVNITIDSANKVLYKDLDIDVTFAPVATGSAGCSETFTAKMTVAANGDVVWKAASAGQAASAPDLVHISRAEIERSGADLGCRYRVSFEAEPAGSNLALRTASLSPINNQTGSTSAAATYAVKAVPVTVTASFPADEVFTTEEQITVTVAVVRPCGGLISALPAKLWSSSDTASFQIFPDAKLYLYGSDLNAVSNSGASRAYAVQAWSDVKGTQPCSISVSVSKFPERCSTPSETQTATYDRGTDKFEIAFPFTCDNETAEASVSDETSADEPPSPPTIQLGETQTEEPSGPLPEGRTG